MWNSLANTLYFCLINALDNDNIIRQSRARLHKIQMNIIPHIKETTTCEHQQNKTPILCQPLVYSLHTKYVKYYETQPAQQCSIQEKR